MKLASFSLFHKDLQRHGLDFALQRSTALGFDAVEMLYTNDPMPTSKEVKEARSRFDSYGMPVIGYSVLLNLLTTDFDPVARLQQHAENAAMLGSPFLHHTVYPPFAKEANSPDYHDILLRAVEAAAQVARYAATLGLTCLYEPQGMYFNGIEGLGTFFTQLHAECPNTGVCADAANPLFLGEDPVAVARHFAPFVRHAHVKNYTLQDTEPSSHERYLLEGGKWLGATALTEGVVNIPAYLAALPPQCKYVSLEKSGTDDDIRSAIAYLKGLCVEG